MSRKRRRKQTGSAITEFGPSLWIFLILIFFPLMDVLAITLQYCCGWYMNFLLTRELAVRKSTEKTAVCGEVSQAFDRSAPGIKAFIGLVNDPFGTAEVDYTPTTNGVPGVVKCKTTIEGRPFLPVPIPFFKCPGLNDNFRIAIFSERPREVQN